MSKVWNCSGLDQTLAIEALQSQLDTQFFGVGNRLIYLPVVHSTNTVAMQMAHDRPEEGVVVLTDNQTAGKGRQGRRWVDVAGRNVLSSTLLRPLFPPHLLVMLASLAVVDTIDRTCRVRAAIKWPNDVLVGDRKIAGILIETSHDRDGRLVAVLGIGVNANGRFSATPLSKSKETGLGVEAGTEPDQSELSMLSALSLTATTLETECGHEISRETFIAHLLRYLETGYLALQREAMNPSSAVHGSASRKMRERWRSRLATLGCAIQVHQGQTVLSGIAEDVDDNGELLLRRHSGELVSITWGDVRMVSSG
jgi:BirA family transcriptional regulator, biotin operon repressor / biotin---[acetyl-CoA-carboxylase] ligase